MKSKGSGKIVRCFLAPGKKLEEMIDSEKKGRATLDEILALEYDYRADLEKDLDNPD